MGYYAVSIQVTGTRSAHNSAQDQIDKAAWNLLAWRIRQIVTEDPTFEKLGITVTDPTE
jgi:hypothetical protein